MSNDVKTFVSDEYRHVPVHVIEEINRFVDARLHPGDFVKSILCNDLVGVVKYAGAEEKPFICDIVKYIFNNIPQDCWGNTKRYQDWLNTKVH